MKMTDSSTLPLHRIRFIDHSPSPITALQFAPLPLPPPSAPLPGTSSLPTPNYGPLVLARENGEVELWNYTQPLEGYGNWTLQRILPPALTHSTISLMALVLRNQDSYTSPHFSQLRLFTTGSNSSDLVERCLETGRIISTWPIPSPPLWSIAVAPTQDLLCLATASPNLHFVSIPQATVFDPAPPLSDPPAYLLRADPLPSRTRTVSIAFAPPSLYRTDSGEWEYRNTAIVTGNSDSSWRYWTIPAPGSGGGRRLVLKGRAVVEKVQKAGRGGSKPGAGAGKATIVWGVAVLPNGNVVTTDSLGSVTFWSPHTLSQLQTFRPHKADAMCLAVASSGTSLFTSGPDQRVAQFVFQSPAHTAAVHADGWVLASTKRLHAHDVKALAVWPPYTPGRRSEPGGEILASGGLDMSLAFTPASYPTSSQTLFHSALGKIKGKFPLNFEESQPRRMSYLSGGPLGGKVDFSRDGRLVAVRKERSVGIWKVEENEAGWEKLLEMELRLRTNLISLALSPNGQYLALSDLYETKIFRLSLVEGKLKVKRLSKFLTILISNLQLRYAEVEKQGCGASKLLFTPDSQRLILGLVASGKVMVIELPQPSLEVEEEIKVIGFFKTRENVIAGRVIREMPNGNHLELQADEDNSANRNDYEGDEMSMDEESESDFGHGKKQESNSSWISSLAVSIDGQWLAVADLSGSVCIFNLDTLQLHATLPTFPYPPTTLNFPSSSNLLCILHSQNYINFYHVERRRLLSRTPELEKLNSVLSALQTPMHGILWRTSNLSYEEGRALIWGGDYLVTIKIDLDLLMKTRKNLETSMAGLTPSIDLEGKAGRRKRAREANVAKLSTSASSLPQSPNAQASSEGFYKIIPNRFKNVLGVGLFVNKNGREEVGVVERPWSDFVGELPPSFWVSGYGRS
ncbi:uncharacterized protein L203_101231 [Cryptococcus depauperatus CBS 7841]|uniref:U3 small nucleolar RNA-associated protein 4 n=1 Tax=Cryptococcus depauperatus CBS 7841 TaxID=1295531 RepID=A0AAJ8JPL7_9TREE